MSTAPPPSTRVLSPRLRRGPRVRAAPWMGLGAWLFGMLLTPLLPSSDALTAAWKILTVVGVISACALATWAETTLYYTGRAHRRRLRFAGIAVVAPALFLALVFALDALLERAGYSGDLLLVSTIAAAWFVCSHAGSALILLLDLGASAFLGSFRNRVRALVLILLAFGSLVSVWGAPLLFETLNAPIQPEIWGSSDLVAHFASRIASVPGVAEFTGGSTPGLVFVGTVILLVALPSILSATAKFAGLVMERIYPLAAAFGEIAKGERAVRVEEGGSLEFIELSQRFNSMVGKLETAERMERAFGSYVSTQLLESIRAQHGEATLASSIREASVFFADIRGFTSMSERLSAEQVVQVLNTFFARAVELVDEHQGYLNKFLGDALMVVFNGPLEQPDHRARAVQCAIALQHAIGELNKKRAFPHVGALAVGVGVASGPMVCGNVGSDKQMEYTVIGDVVNTASRLCSQAGGGEIWMVRATAEGLPKGIATRPLPPLQVKGKVEPVEVVAWPA